MLRRWVIVASALAAVSFAGCQGVEDDGSVTSALRHDLSVKHDLAVAESIDPNGGGGTVSLLSFGVFGDARPTIPNDSSAYPTTVLNEIFKGMVGQHAQFAIGTGDYMFVVLDKSAATSQLGAMKKAAKKLDAPVFYAMGNHECNSLNELNCPKLDESTNIRSFLADLLPWTPVPWYDFTVHTSLGDAKFLFIAANAWNTDQAAWLKKALEQKTTYTFVVRHEPTPDAGDPSTAAGIAGSNTLLKGKPITLFLYGHVHEYLHLTTNAVIAGNAGAPLVSGEYGWLNIEQRADSTISVTAYSVTTGMPIDSWAVTSEGLAAP